MFNPNQVVAVNSLPARARSLSQDEAGAMFGGFWRKFKWSDLISRSTTADGRLKFSLKPAGVTALVTAAAGAYMAYKVANPNTPTLGSLFKSGALRIR